MNRLIKTPYNADQFPKYRESKFGISQTVPDMSMTIREIMDRFARGLPIDGEKVAMYHGEDTPIDTRKLDLSELHDLRSALSADIIRMQEELQKEGVEFQEAENYKKFKERYEKENATIVQPKNENDEEVKK